MLRLAGSRQAELAADANHPCGDAQRPQREREPPICSAIKAPTSPSVVVPNRMICVALGRLLALSHMCHNIHMPVATGG
jgi:hypothetical protein